MENAISWHSMPMFTPILLVSPPRPSPLAPPLTLRYCTLFAMIEQYYREKVPTEHLLRFRFFFFFFFFISLKVATEMLCLSQKISVNLDNNVGHRSLVSFLGTRCYCSLLYEQSQCSNGCRLIVPPSDYCDALIFKNSFLEKVGPSTETQGLWVDLKSGRESLRTLSYQASSKRSQSFWLLIGARKSLYFSAPSEWSML